MIEYSLMGVGLLKHSKRRIETDLSSIGHLMEDTKAYATAHGPIFLLAFDFC